MNAQEFFKKESENHIDFLKIISDKYPKTEKSIAEYLKLVVKRAINQVEEMLK